MSDPYPYLGEIRMFGGVDPPPLPGWAVCDGRLLQISEFPELYSVIGNMYGGDGSQTFAVPDLRGRVPLHVCAGTYAPAQTGGAEQVILDITQLPSHTHVALAAATKAGTDTPTGNFWAGSSKYQEYATAPDGTVMSAQALTAFGGGQAHDNMHPYLPINFIIALHGRPPSRDEEEAS